jgi:hypothetical protein
MRGGIARAVSLCYKIGMADTLNISYVSDSLKTVANGGTVTSSSAFDLTRIHRPVTNKGNAKWNSDRRMPWPAEYFEFDPPHSGCSLNGEHALPIRRVQRQAQE